MRPLGTSLGILLLGTAIHLDWHFARPTHHRLSLGLSWHWLLAVPVFALAAYYVARQNPRRPVAVSVVLLGGGALLGAVLEPAYEYFIGHAPYDWAFGPDRTWGALSYIVTGIVAYGVTFLLLRRQEPSPAP